MHDPWIGQKCLHTFALPLFPYCILWHACNEEGDGFHVNNKLAYAFAVDIYFVCISSYGFVFIFRSVSSRKDALSDVVDTVFSKKWLRYLVFHQLEI